MKISLRRFLALAALAVLAAAGYWNGPAAAGVYSGAVFGTGASEQYSVLTINADGSCRFTTKTIASRTTTEQQVRLMERFQKISEAADADEATPKPDLTVTNDTKLLTDEELVKKINEKMTEAAGDSDQKINVEVKQDTVITTTTHTFATLEDMLKESYAVWLAGSLAFGSLAFENARAEMDTNGLLRLTLTPQKGMDHYLKTLRPEWKLSGEKAEFKLVFPGKVVSSGFPAMQTNATWMAVDGKQDESLDALAKLYAAPTVITAEPGGLKLDQPLESLKLWRSRERLKAGGDDLPVTDAGPGFLAEAQSITTTTLQVFPGGEEYFRQSRVVTGAVVNVKLFAPKGRTMKSVSNPRVIAAVDDKGRSVMVETDDAESSSDVMTSGSPDAGSLPIELRLQLPQPDARAIDKISAEAVATTVGTWKEMTLTNLQANATATNELDLSAVLPGAKMVITKYSLKHGQFNLQASLKGPPAVKRLEVRAKIPNNDQFNSNSSDRQSSIKNGAATRSIVVQGYSFGGQDASSQDAAVLVVRYPNDLQRERVRFELKSLDLL